MKSIICIYLFSLLLLSGKAQQKAVANGDIIFIQHSSGQGKAIQLATKSKFTHVGILFIENGKPMVYHAVEPVKVNSLAEFIAMSEDGRYEIKHLKNKAQLTDAAIAQMLKEAKSKLGTHYDLAFNWSDEELYCSEFVWKLYFNALKLELGALKPLKDFDLSHPIVKALMEKRYGKQIPLNEKMISPGDMFSSSLLE